MYLGKTLYLPLTLETDDLRILKWWIDASYAPHGHMRSHTGASMTLGKGDQITLLVNKILIQRVPQMLKSFQQMM